MSPNIQIEARLLLFSLGAGAALDGLYWGLRLLRRVIRHGWLMVGIEDLAYWIFAGFSVFYLLYRENDGALRLYVVGSVLLSMAVCDAAVRSILEKVLKKTKKCFKMISGPKGHA